MPISCAALTTHLDYTAWASRLIASALKPLSPEELTRAAGTSHGSLIETLRHIYFADRIWLSRLEGTSRPFREEGEAPGLQEMEEAWFPMLERFKALVGAFGEDDVAAPFTYRNLAGEEFSMPRWQAVLHVVNHATLHRGQIVTMLRQLGHAAPATDLLFYFRSR
jgi:uncharacterized damage-inducible protein DinB